MKHVSLTGLALCFLAVPVLGQDPRPDRPQFRVGVNTVSVAVTLFDKKGRLVTGLDEDNFTIFEDGVEQDIEFFAHRELPLKMVILLDVSTSMRQKLPMAQEAAIGFVGSLKPGDEVQVVEFGERVLTLVDFTSDFDDVAKAIRSTKVKGATALYRALYVSIKDLEAYRRDELDRRAVVVLSDGNDTISRLGFEDVKTQARKSNVIIYAISLRASRADLKKEKYRNAKYELDMLARESAGNSYAPEKLKDLAGVYEEIATELKSQYSLGYVSTNNEHDGKWRRLQILTAASGTVVRVREGYYAPRKSRLRRRRRRP
ncbi:MAG: VWA domain-containing protein [Acidobacteria bacterium]|nr:MAG: VWA domain-containing protein [Acidobacteriota bacterium]